MKKGYFPTNSATIWCGSCWKNLKSYLLQSEWTWSTGFRLVGNWSWSPVKVGCGVSKFVNLFTVGHWICTLISENQGLEKLRSVSNLRKKSPSFEDYVSGRVFSTKGSGHIQRKGNYFQFSNGCLNKKISTAFAPVIHFLLI